MIDETVLAQSVSADRSAISDSNNRGNAGRDIINNYGMEDFYKGKVFQDKLILSKASVS